MSHRIKRLVVAAAAAVSLMNGSGGLAVGAEEAGKVPAATTQVPVVPCVPGVEIVKALAWPLGILVVALVFRRSITAFVSALGTRVTKLSLFQVQLELVPATSAASTTPLLDEIRTATTSAPINDSSRMMLEQVQVGAAADFAIIALGCGTEWLTSRLFIAAAMLERMRGVQVLVFVDRKSDTDRHFVAVAPVPLVRWALAKRYPHLEAAWADAYLGLFPQTVTPNSPQLPPSAVWRLNPKEMTAPQPIITSNTGGVDPWSARMLVSRFIESLQRPAASAPTPSAPGWVSLRGTVQERADWVTREMLQELLPPDSFRSSADALRDAPSARRTRAVLRRVAPFVALTEDNREFVRLVNRRALLEEIAAHLGEEPDTN